MTAGQLLHDRVFSPRVDSRSGKGRDALPSPAPGVDGLRELAVFRGQLRSCLYRRGNTLLELADAILCTAGPVQSPVELSLEPEVLRRHSSVYDALHHGGGSADRP
ncbi:hypothetical protein [Streptomyces sp. A5-4]|uniref:hypothetical protein n=1 Tax=Streptomyces sp. A5-4 TaxID=3384771 RepID=UPI003DA99C1A